jgi:phosphoribosylformylglycinamidine synthase subunit PurQ / glutaminase
MPQKKVLVLRAAGINCDLETAKAFEIAGGDPRPMHLNRVLESPSLLKDFGCLAIPGGFSYGDDVAAGKILAIELSVALGDALRAFVDRGGLILGVCNGFQVLVKTGLLPGSLGGKPVAATLAWNDSHRYEDRWVRLRTDASRCVFVERNDAILELPVAHGEGRFLVAPPERLDALIQDGRSATSEPTAATPRIPKTRTVRRAASRPRATKPDAFSD